VTKVVFLSEIPTPYRIPFYERLARREELDVTVLYCAQTEPDRPWKITHCAGAFPHEFLPGIALPIRTRRNTFVYEINPTIVSRLRSIRPDVVVIGGYSVFAEQAAIAYATAVGLPWVIHSESHLLDQRSPVRRATKALVLGAVLRRASGALAVGTMASRYLEHYGIPRELIRTVPNTIDVSSYAEAARAARENASRIRKQRSLPDRFHLFVGRLVADKGLEDLLEARTGRNLPPLVVAGEGPLRSLVADARDVLPLGFQNADRLIELYALADVTVVPSRYEPWGVVVNEALACGSPVIATDAVGATVDLIRSEDDGLVVTTRDVSAIGQALERTLAPHEPGTGAVAGWTYAFGVEQFTSLISALDV
jgi:glycosyltransferase involved in cell wall biosynthesis